MTATKDYIWKGVAEEAEKTGFFFSLGEEVTPDRGIKARFSYGLGNTLASVGSLPFARNACRPL